MSDATPDASATAPRVTHFNFQSRVFQAPGAHFVLMADGPGQPKKPMFGVEMGTGFAMISLTDLRKNFGIPDGSLDDALISRAEAGLHYVPDIRPGDAIPNELLDGTASWTVGRKHKRIARERIQAGLLKWVTGKAVEAENRAKLTEIMESPETKKMLREAFNRAAAALGLDDAEKVVDRIETLARELCYIEALRERCGQVSRINRMLKPLTAAYANDPRTVDEISRIVDLMKKASREIKTPFNFLDMRIADIMNALQSLDDVIEAIRDTRDNVHFILMQWDPVIERWKDLAPEKGQQIDKALQALYRMLASRFSSGKSLMGFGSEY